MKTVLYYHAYLTDDCATWANIVTEQFNVMQYSGLLDHVDKIRISAITQNDMRNIYFINIVSSFADRKKLEVETVLNPHKNDNDMLAGLNSDKTITENHTMRKLYADAAVEDMTIFYCHTKGITAVDNWLRRGVTDDYLFYFYWRQYLQWGTIENWKKCVEALKEYDVAGVNYYDEPFRHYSGAYWWTTSKYIKTLPDPSTVEWWHKLKLEKNDSWCNNASDRNRDEMWICYNPEVKSYNHFPLKMNQNPAGKFLPKNFYC